MNKGIWYGIAAYAMWGFFPIYWKLLHEIPAIQLLGHRIVWSFLLLAAFILLTKQAGDFRSVAFNRRTLGIYTIAGVLLSANWLIYVWSVNAGFIVETSLGYFINPLLSVLFGVIFLRERLRPAQWVPVIIAAIGVTYLTVAYGRPPWIALSLAVTFGLYGLVKKLSPLGSVYGLTLETGIVFPIALLYLIVVQAGGAGEFLRDSFTIDLLLIGAGVVTTIPLLMFASAAKQIPLNMIGVLQYFAPTIQFLIGVFIYKEPFDHTRLIGFGIVWLALIIFWVENFIAHRNPVEPIPELGK
ncbi:MAG: EamA family transporter RarD [Chloroflexi bacterium CFX1]|nr:EamA family transporter RarD [Chloroflexi bacterium CFX1]MCQ3951744.1 EamA family transporter RarD [Chloroflexota bacterium]MDL1917935.1 EamA family transporter RarD [Chloroflexi bacterium CFX5]NUQ59217.1 EamA family transporter RarD [Anaerolineales bacterium]